MSTIINIDGSYLEGGGQITRTAVALSAVTGKPVKIFKIRKGRTRPGLSAQHLTGIKAAAKLCNAETKGVELRSTEIEFTPKKIKAGSYKFDIGTAGSITLLLQTLIPICLHADKKTTLEITGGTDVKWSMDKNFFQYIFLYYLNEKMYLDIWLDTIKRGFYPKGGGKIKITISPKKPPIIKILERGKLKEIDVHSVSSKDLKKRNVAERQIRGFEKIIVPTRKYMEYVDSISPGTTMHAHYSFEKCKLGSTIIGERSMKAEDVGIKCASLLKNQIDSGACLDRWMADQILPYMALAVCDNITSQTNSEMAGKIKSNIGNLTKNESSQANGRIFSRGDTQKLKCKVSVAEISKHCLTNAWVIEKFLPVKFKIHKEKSIIGVKPISK